MRKLSLLGIILGVLLGYSLCFAGMDMGYEGHDMGGMEMKHESNESSDHIKTVKSGGYVFKFNLIDMQRKMEAKGMGDMDMGGMTHHLMVFVEEEGSCKKITDAKVKYKIFTPGEKESETMAMAMSGGYGADINMAVKGKYGIACMVKMGEKKELVKFNYEK